MHGALRRSPAAYRIFDTTSPAPIEGVVRHKGLHDEQTGAPFVVVETARREAHYVRVDPAESEGLAVGERVRIVATPARWLTAPDHVIQRVAAVNRGVYSAAAHLRQLQARPVTIEGLALPPESIVEVNVRRLKRLERYKLVTRVANGQWKVAPDLVEILRDRETTHPQHRIQIERLDRVVDRTATRTKNRSPDRGG
jgi:hypothetical protein